MTMAHNFERMSVILDPQPWHDTRVERLWVSRIAETVFRLENSPFYAYGLSFGDYVIARNVDGVLTFEKASRSGGHSTYRIIAAPSTDLEKFSDELKLQLRAFGCSFEGNGRGVFSIDVPPAADVEGLYCWLSAGETEAKWSFEEAHFGKNPS